MQVYQIICKGYLACAEGFRKIHSRKVFKHYPTEEEISTFCQSCITPAYPGDFYYLREDGISFRIVALEVVE
jgi:hypothetical protein